MKKRNGTWNQDEEEADEELESRHVEKQNVQNLKTENKMQNGVLSNSTVIARSKDLILVPEPEMQNHRNHLEETKAENSQASTTVGKSEVDHQSLQRCTIYAKQLFHKIFLSESYSSRFV